MFASIIYIALVASLTWVRPIWGLVLAANAFLINAASGLESGAAFMLVGLGGPLVCFATVFLKKFFEGSAWKFVVGIDGWLVIVLFNLMLLSIVYAKDPESAQEASVRFLVLCLSFYFMVKFIVLNSDRSAYVVQDYFIAVLWVGVVSALYGLWEGKSSSDYMMRLTIGNVSSIPLSVLLGQSFMLSVYFFILKDRRLERLTYLFCSVLLLYVLILTNTRSTLVGVALSAVFSLLCLGKLVGPKVFIYAFGGILAVVALISPTLLVFGEKLTRLTSGFQRLLTGELGESEADRLAAWRAAVEMFSENIFFGVGSGNFEQNFISYPHNIFLELLSENGLFGIVTLSLLIGLAILRLFSLVRSYEIMVGAGFVFCLFVAQVSMTLWMHKALFIWMSLLFTTIYLRDVGEYDRSVE